GVGEGSREVAGMTHPEDESGKTGGDGCAQGRIQSVLESVVRCRSGSCFTWYARTRNFAYGTNCFIAPTFTWHGLRQVGQTVFFTCSRCARFSALKYSSSAGVVSTLPIGFEFSQ